MPKVTKKSIKQRNIMNRKQMQQRRLNETKQDNIENDQDSLSNCFELPKIFTDNTIKAGNLFDKECGNIFTKTCILCNRSFYDIQTNKEIICIDCNKSNKFSADNNMGPGSVPEKLLNLSYIEQMLIAKIHPIITIYRIQGNQYSYSGNIIHFRQNINEYIKKLPIHPNDFLGFCKL